MAHAYRVRLAPRGGSDSVSTRSIFAFIPSYLRSFALKPCFAQGGRRAGLARECHADARSAMKLRRTPDRSTDAHRLVGVPCTSRTIVAALFSQPNPWRKPQGNSIGFPILAGNSSPIALICGVSSTEAQRLQGSQRSKNFLALRATAPGSTAQSAKNIFSEIPEISVLLTLKVPSIREEFG